MSSKDPADAVSAAAFAEGDVLCRTEIEESEELIGELVGLLASHHAGVDGGAALEAVLARERESPTFIARGVAMPHARLDGLEAPLVAAATSEDGVEFAGAGQTANLVLVVLTPKCSPAAYLKIAASIARRLRTQGFLDEALSCAEPAELCALFNGDRQFHSSVTAADMMSPPGAVLQDTNSVKDAIDAIVKTGLAEIPVVDKAGDLVGVASARALLGICVPDYMLWMEDLSLFSNFEPFETLLKNESSTWLADITDDDYASVAVDQPAIAVAEAMARHKTNRCFVLDGARLAGVVTLPSFLNNIFRD
ncbi:MAG: PTS sugar transporter subunit IIA [Kiritimatiellae bacterium]|nr:PTS sugar transporter subunit IIA [Kiritimatiellia bacterium]